MNDIVSNIAYGLLEGSVIFALLSYAMLANSRRKREEAAAENTVRDTANYDAHVAAMRAMAERISKAQVEVTELEIKRAKDIENGEGWKAD